MTQDYLDLNVRLMKQIDRLADDVPEKGIDAWVRTKRQELRATLSSEGISTDILESLFHQESMIEKGYQDEDILALFSSDQDIEAMHIYNAMNIDFYCIEYMLRRHEKPHLVNYGTIQKKDIDSAKDLENLIYKSNYFRELSPIQHKNYRKKMDEIMYRTFKPRAYQGIGVDGVVSKVILYNLLLDSTRVDVKSKKFGIQSPEIVRDFHV